MNDVYRFATPDGEVYMHVCDVGTPADAARVADACGYIFIDCVDEDVAFNTYTPEWAVDTDWQDEDLPF